MNKWAYYNEFNPYAAQWLRNLIDAGLIAPGVVDERSIEDVAPEDLRGFAQVHLFAGVGGWSIALRAAGVPDEYPIWSASTPCQPFSAAGAGAGFADERHLWPTVEHLARECRPARLIGEQVASRDAEPWLDLVQDDMEALGYAFGAVAFPSAGVGAPHIRDRTYWVAYADCERSFGQHTLLRPEESGRIGAGSVLEAAGGGAAGRLGDSQLQQRSDGQRGIGLVDEARGRNEGAAASAGLRGVGGLADANGRTNGRESEILTRSNVGRLAACDGGSIAEHGPAGPTNGYWADADWLGCRDGKWRPVEPGTFPLAHGAPARVGRLRAYGNAINAYQAQVFIEAHLLALSGAETEPMGGN